VMVLEVRDDDFQVVPPSNGSTTLILSFNGNAISIAIGGGGGGGGGGAPYR